MYRPVEQPAESRSLFQPIIPNQETRLESDDVCQVALGIRRITNCIGMI